MSTEGDEFTIDRLHARVEYLERQCVELRAALDNRLCPWGARQTGTPDGVA